MQSLCASFTTMQVAPATSAPKAASAKSAKASSMMGQGVTVQGWKVGGVKRGELQVRAARVAGVEIPNNKRAEIALTYVYGIGNTSAKKIMAKTGLENKRVREMEEEELTILRAEVDTYMIEGDLRRFNMLNIKRLKEIQCYRGRRHIRGLPCRGQRTKTNARTRKGKIKTVAGKKK